MAAREPLAALLLLVAWMKGLSRVVALNETLSHYPVVLPRFAPALATPKAPMYSVVSYILSIGFFSKQKKNYRSIFYWTWWLFHPQVGTNNPKVSLKVVDLTDPKSELVNLKAPVDVVSEWVLSIFGWFKSKSKLKPLENLKICIKHLLNSWGLVIYFLITYSVG